MFLLMVIDNLHVRRAGRTFPPFEANPPAVVDADAVLALSVSFQPFKTVAGQHRKVFEHDGRFQPVQRGLVSSPDQWPWSSFRFYHLQDSFLLSMDQLA